MQQHPDLAKTLQKLRKNRSPLDFLDHVPSPDCIGRDWISESDWDPIREAWLAGQFAWGLQQSEHKVQLRLREERENYPDFHLVFKGKEMDFEITEALTPRRKRDHEWKTLEYHCIALAAQNPMKNADLDKAIADAVSKKAEKKYPRGAHLLVYANVTGHINPSEIFRLASSCVPFSSVWLIWHVGFWAHIVKLSDTGIFPHEQFSIIQVCQKL